MNQDRKNGAGDFSLTALQSGDRAEFARFVEYFSPQIYRLALKMLHDPQDAEDALQETFIKSLRALPGFEGRSSLSTWLYRIALNEILMLLRKRKPESISIDAEPEDDEQPSVPLQLADWCCLPEKELLNGESRAFLDAAIGQLSTALQAVFLLRDVQGLSVRETADALNISEAAVKTRLLRARLALRESLTHYYTERLTKSGAESEETE